jgi:hypothetical protein
MPIISPRPFKFSKRRHNALRRGVRTHWQVHQVGDRTCRCCCISVHQQRERDDGEVANESSPVDLALLLLPSGSTSQSCLKHGSSLVRRLRWRTLTHVPVKIQTRRQISTTHRLASSWLFENVKGHPNCQLPQRYAETRARA